MAKGLITTELHYNVVRNAWRGPETFITHSGHPATIEVDKYCEDELRKECRWYRHVEDDVLTLTATYARLDVWPFIKLASVVRNYTHDVLGHLYRQGILHACRPYNMRWRWRDLRPGPYCYPGELDD